MTESSTIAPSHRIHVYTLKTIQDVWRYLFQVG